MRRGAKAINAEVMAIEEKRETADRVAAARMNAEREERLALAAKLEKQRKERQAEDAKRQQRETPILAKWGEADERLHLREREGLDVPLHRPESLPVSATIVRRR